VRNPVFDGSVVEAVFLLGRGLGLLWLRAWLIWGRVIAPFVQRLRPPNVLVQGVGGLRTVPVSNVARKGQAVQPRDAADA
jgi:hypothetical protein